MWLRMAKAGVRFWYVAESCGTYLKRQDSLEHKHQELCRAETQQIRGAV